MRSIVRLRVLGALLFALLGHALPAVAGTAQGCPGEDFATFFRQFVESPAVRDSFTAPAVDRGAPFPIAFHGWNFIAANSPAGAPRYLAVVLRHPTAREWRVEWVAMRYDAEPADGRWIGVPVEALGAPGRLTFTAAEDGCWRLTDDARAVADSPFRPGLQRLPCHVRSDDYAAALAQAATGLPDDPAALELGWDLASCLRLGQEIERIIRDDPALAALRHAGEAQLAALTVQRPPAWRAALERDEARFRRGLMRDVFILGDGSFGEWDPRPDLSARLEGRLALLSRLDQPRQGVEGRWRNASGTVTVGPAERGRYSVEADAADIDFLGWTCEIAETMVPAGGGLASEVTSGAVIRLRVEGGLLVVEQDGASEFCGAGGTLAGTYFPLGPE
ncbi:hypothetical protein [Zavarzinia sp.]|uniref:hypothetical protein n=1 Tax=Zavarzinia sp. TaxID=2027920 RepID=UPI0035676E89